VVIPVAGGSLERTVAVMDAATSRLSTTTELANAALEDAIDGLNDAIAELARSSTGSAGDGPQQRVAACEAAVRRAWENVSRLERATH
jgi:hypothetical protein